MIYIICHKTFNFGVGRLALCIKKMLEYNSIVHSVLELNTSYDCIKSNDTCIFVCNEVEWIKKYKDFYTHLECYRIAIWSWEMPIFPITKKSDELYNLDEVWTISEFCRKAIQTSFDKNDIKIPVKCIKIPALNHVTSPSSDILQRYHINDASFVVYSICDFASDMIRKNVIGIIKSFAEFSHGIQRNAILVLKLRGMETNLIGYYYIKNIASQYSNIIMITDTLDENDMNTIMDRCNCILAPFRSEGLCFIVLDGLSKNKPCIHTDYSGVSDYNTCSMSFFIKHKLVECTNSPIYNTMGVWAEPDEKSIVYQLKKIYHERPDKNIELIQQNCKDFKYTLEECSKSLLDMFN